MTTKQHVQRTIFGFFLYPFILIGVLAAWVWISIQAGYKAGDDILTKIVTDKDAPI